MAPLAMGLAGAIGGLGSGIAASAGTGALIGGTALGAASGALPSLLINNDPQPMPMPMQDPFLRTKSMLANTPQMGTSDILAKRFSRYA